MHTDDNYQRSVMEGKLKDIFDEYGMFHIVLPPVLYSLRSDTSSSTHFSSGLGPLARIGAMKWVHLSMEKEREVDLGNLRAWVLWHMNGRKRRSDQVRHAYTLSFLLKLIFLYALVEHISSRMPLNLSSTSRGTFLGSTELLLGC
jgi:hypothetical protein